MSLGLSGLTGLSGVVGASPPPPPPGPTAVITSNFTDGVLSLFGNSSTGGPFTETDWFVQGPSYPGQSVEFSAFQIDGEDASWSDQSGGMSISTDIDPASLNFALSPDLGPFGGYWANLQVFTEDSDSAADLYFTVTGSWDPTHGYSLTMTTNETQGGSLGSPTATLTNNDPNIEITNIIKSANALGVVAFAINGSSLAAMATTTGNSVTLFAPLAGDSIEVYLYEYGMGQNGPLVDLGSINPPSPPPPPPPPPPP